MNIIDKSAFLPHKRVLTITLNNGLKRTFNISLNLNVDTYYSALCYLSNFEEKQNANDIVDTVSTILCFADNRINRNYVIKNIDTKTQAEIITQVMSGVNELLNAEYLRIPDIQVKEKIATTKFDKERAEKKSKIKNVNKLLAKRQEVSLIEDITLVMMKTGNSYFDIMKMPVLVFKNIVKQIILNEMRVDEDYNLAYLNYQLERYREEINSGKAVISTSEKGADIKGLKALLAK